MWFHYEIRNVADIPRHYGRTKPNDRALIDGRGTRTFAQLDQDSNRIASALIADGIKPGSHVGFLARTRRATSRCCSACSRPARQWCR